MKKKVPLTLFALVPALVAFAYFASTQNWIKTIVSTKASGTSESAKVATPEDRKVQFAEASIAKHGEDAEAHRLLAGALITRAETTSNAADYDRAWTELDRAESLEQTVTARVLTLRASLLLSRHRFAQSRTVAEEGLKKWTDNVELLGIAGDGALESGDLATAEKHYQHLVETSPRLSGAWARLSHLEEVRGNFAEASRLMEKSIDVSYPKPLSVGGIAWTRSILGEIEAKRGNLDEARRQYDWALNKVPDYPLALEFLADLEQWQGHPDAAEQIYRNLLSKKADPKWQMSLATLLEKRGAKDEAAQLRAEARKFYEQTVAGGNEGYLRPLATLELDEHHYQRAAELAARDLALRPTTESRAIYANIIKAANDAGQPLTIAQNVQ